MFPPISLFLGNEEQLAAMSSHFHAIGINILHPLEKGMIEAVFFTLKLSQIVHI
jgi:hypothetical protein